jgi:hypothetical protein
MKHEHVGDHEEYCSGCVREVSEMTARHETVSRIAGSILLLALAASTIILAIHYARGIH